MSEGGEDQAVRLGRVAGCSDSELGGDGGCVCGRQGGWRCGELEGSISATGCIVASNPSCHVPWAVMCPTCGHMTVVIVPSAGYTSLSLCQVWSWDFFGDGA